MQYRNSYTLRSFLALTITALFIVGCGGGGKQEQETAADIIIMQETVPPGALPDVPAELGGEGFTGEGWLSNNDYESTADPRGKIGGSITWAISEFPATLRSIGKDSNSQFISLISDMVYEGLITIHPTTLEFTPVLATHWKISDDYKTFSFRINPNARFADGSRVTSEDVIASWKLRVDSGILAPYTNIIWNKFEEPVAESPYIVRVQAKELNWKFFLYFGSVAILPAKYIGGITGSEYMKKYQFELLPGTGPYRLDKKNIIKGRSLTLKRRDDYWDKDNPKRKGYFNFKRIKFSIVNDERLRFEKFKKGEFDFYLVGRAQWWMEECNFESIKRGLIQKRKVWNDDPQGVSGFVFNMRVPPFNDKRMRQVFACLMNREKLISQLFFNEYTYIDSYYPGSVYENPNNPKYRYNPEKAVQLLSECGWKERNSDGWLVNDKGQIFELTISFSAKSFERILTVYQEDLKRVGIKLSLKMSQGSTLFKMVNERKFNIHFQSWTGLLFPNPENSVSSWTADPQNTTNLAGIKNDRIDELIKEYNVCFDQEKRIKMIREIDSILMDIQHYALGWYAPFQRILYWNRFGHPDSYLSRTGDWLGVLQYWWVDEAKEKELKEAKKSKSKQLEVGEVQVKYWEEYNKLHGRDYTLK
ncbi:MAG: extracellular solute-binding protein [Candidatus Hatepunaea meridiana]|nr:extracellular solute-binding protein [Candidatus Hatepunaea meridiana]